MERPVWVTSDLAWDIEDRSEHHCRITAQLLGSDVGKRKEKLRAQ